MAGALHHDTMVESVFMDVDRMPLLARNVPWAQNMKSSKQCPQAQHLALHYACYFGFNVTPYIAKMCHILFLSQYSMVFSDNQLYPQIHIS